MDISSSRRSRITCNEKPMPTRERTRFPSEGHSYLPGPYARCTHFGHMKVNHVCLTDDRCDDMSGAEAPNAVGWQPCCCSLPVGKLTHVLDAFDVDASSVVVPMTDQQDNHKLAVAA